MKVDRLSQIENRIEELNDYKNKIDFTDKRLEYQIECELNRLELEKEDILYGTHNIEIMNLRLKLEYYYDVKFSPRRYNKVLLDYRIEKTKEELASLIVENNDIKKNKALVRRNKNNG